MRTAYIGMGANLPSHAGSPEATLAAAAARLESLGRVPARSSLYSTVPVGYADQPRFLNAAVTLDTGLTPIELLGALLLIEQDFGRNRANAVANGPRTLDLDILLYGDLVIGSSSLVIPHERLAERAFVLVPLNEIAPTAIDPRSGLTVSQLLQSLVPNPGHDVDAVVQVKCDFWRPGVGAVLVLALLTAPSLDSQSPQPAAPATAQSIAAPPAPVTTVTVTAYRTPLGALESPVATRLLSRRALGQAAAVTLDGRIRQIPGLELFRRSSSLVANPTSQGVSLRGLGSTSASRTLVTQDDVPLNDPIGGWIHWQEQPELAIGSVELVRGGASDLYGSSAIGGVINVIPVRPASQQAELRSSYGAQGTYDDSLLLQAKRGPWGVLTSSGLIGTNGFIQEAPSQRGPVDVASNVHSQNALLIGEHDRGSLRLFARGNGFNELRHNGTPYQMNATRLIRYATGADWQGPRNASLVARFYGSSERYRQTFSSLSNVPNAANPTCSFRCGETPTKFAYIPVNELGATAHWSQPLGAGFLLVAGADVHDVRFWDREQSYTGTAALTNLRDHQRDSAAWIEALWVHGAWTLAASGRMDWFQNYDARQLTWTRSTWTPSATQPPQRNENIFDPRLGLSRKLSPHWAVSASGFRAFRAPTPSELYRATQVGNKLTNPNGNLLSERATGWETALSTEWSWGTVRSSYFLTQVNRPIVAVTINPTSSPILLSRQNLGQIESRGVALDFEFAPRSWLAVDGGYQYAHATVSRGSQDLGNWIPEVARNMATLNLRAFKPKLGALTLQSRLSGRQFDDDANAFMLHGYFRLDAYASHNFGRHIELFAAAENLLDRHIEASKTPTTTLATPRTARIGFQFQVGAGK